MTGKRDLFFGLFVASICLGVTMIQQSLNVLPFVQDAHIGHSPPCRQPAPQQQQQQQQQILPHPSYGRKIVESAFNETYVHLVNFNCSRYKLFYNCVRDLLTQASRPHAQKWPWWFTTLLRDAKKPNSGFHGKWHHLQFPEQNMELCVYEKGGTKQWRYMHCLATNNSFVKEGLNYFECYKKQAPRENREKFVFLRDPLDRFLSGFIDKCIRSVVENHCEPLSIFTDQNSTHIADIITDKNKKRFFEAYVDAMPLKWNMHFFPEAFNCGGLYQDLGEYKFIGSMGHTLYSDIARLVSDKPTLERPAHKVFEYKSKMNETNTGGKETGAAKKVLEYYTPHTVRRVLELQSIDYMMLGLEIPQWAEDMLANDAMALP